MKVDSQLPSFESVKEWLNQATADAPETKGHPTLVHFWSIGSEVSLSNLTQVAELRDQRKREGLRVVAVPIPTVGTLTDPKVVKDVVTRFNLTEPCAMDNNNKLRDSFLNYLGFVPAYYLFDIHGRLRSFSAGESGLEIFEDQLDELFIDLRDQYPFCPECELFLDEQAMFCPECGTPLTLPGSGAHPYYESHHSASLPTVRLFDPDPLIGQSIDGKYELLARLGEGGMSIVYRARRVHIGDEVAVKILLPKFVHDEAALARFRREARAAGILHHANVITIHDFGEGNGQAPTYIVMEFVKGTPLRELLKSADHFPTERALRLMKGICAGVAAAHRHEVIHRDLKPENIIVVAPDDDYEFETIRVVDFGLAKILMDDVVTAPGTVVGTPYYMSPEQCLGEPLDTRSDVYSLGAMFYEMLSGKRPFAGETVSDLIKQHLSEPPPPLPSTLKIPRRVSTAIMHALAKEPDDRPQTAREFSRQLQLV